MRSAPLPCPADEFHLVGYDQDGRIAATIRCRIDDDLGGGKVVFCMFLAVSRDHRRRGVGSLAQTATLQEVRDRFGPGEYVFETRVAVGNAAPIRLITDLGMTCLRMGRMVMWQAKIALPGLTSREELGIDCEPE